MTQAIMALVFSHFSLRVPENSGRLAAAARLGSAGTLGRERSRRGKGGPAGVKGTAAGVQTRETHLQGTGLNTHAIRRAMKEGVFGPKDMFGDRGHSV